MSRAGSGGHDTVDAAIRDRMRNYVTICGTNPPAQELIREAKQLRDNLHEADVRLVKQTFNYVLKRQTKRHQQEWKDAENATLALLGDVRRYKGGKTDD